MQTQSGTIIAAGSNAFDFVLHEGSMVPQPQPQPGVMHVLVAEDDMLVRVVLAEELRALGFAVIEAGCADDALAYIRAGGKVDLVFSAIQMPGALDGRQLAAFIASDYPAIPVILTSGDTQLGASVTTGLFIAKPYSIARIVTLFLSVLGLLPGGGRS